MGTPASWEPAPPLTFPKERHFANALLLKALLPARSRII
jgi:hypothetical protein